MRSERPDHTLQPTSLVHEAYLKLSRRGELSELDRLEILSLAARAMRQILVDHARHRRTNKRGGRLLRVTLSDGLAASEPAWDIVALHEALERLASFDPRQVDILELRFLGGLSVEEVASLLDISATTVKRETAIGQAWLFRELRQSDSGSAH
jgi:RNA polymerase sigma-70 factor (ECF subfamily)